MLAIKVDDFAVLVKFLERADSDIGFVGLNSIDHRFDHLWFDEIIRINESDIIASGFFDAGVAGGGKALVSLADEFDARIFFGVGFGDGGGMVGGAVVDKDDFEI